MESEQVKRRFGRCPYCRAMIYQDPNAVIYYCSKCRTPIRGKNPEPTDETEYALAQLEILSADTASVFSDEQGLPYTAKSTAGHDGGEQPPVRSSTEFHRGSREIGAASSSPFRAFHSVRTGARSSALDAGEQTEPERSGSPLHGFSGEHRPSSRRTRRPMSGEFDAPRDDRSSTGLGMDVPSSAASYRRRASPLSSQELDPSGYEPSGSARSPLTDPAFQHDLLQALDNLRKVIAAVELPYGTEAHRQHAGAVPRMSASCNDRGSGGGAYAPTRRNSRLMRRLESQLVQALPRDASTSSSSSASSSRRAERRSTARKDHCRPILGGTPFVICHKCSEILQLPGAMSMDRTARVQCGGCGEALALTLPASGSTGRPKKIFSAPQPAIAGGADDEEEYVHTRSRLSGEQRRPAEGPLHRMLGYSSVSSVLRSRRYGEHD